jgi:hypothetical protein
MPLTGDFKELVRKRIARDPAFRDAPLREGIDTMLYGDVETGKAIPRDYIKATTGFEKPGEATLSACAAMTRSSDSKALPFRVIAARTVP